MRPRRSQRTGHLRLPRLQTAPLRAVKRDTWTLALLTGFDVSSGWETGLMQCRLTPRTRYVLLRGGERCMVPGVDGIKVEGYHLVPVRLFAGGTVEHF